MADVKDGEQGIKSYEYSVNMENLKLALFTGSEIEILFENKKSSSLHFHIYYEIFFVKSGKTTIKFKDREVSLNQNDILIVPPNVLHCATFSTCKKNSYSFYFSLSKNSLKTELDMYDSVKRRMSGEYILIRNRKGQKMIVDKLSRCAVDRNPYDMGVCFFELFTNMLKSGNIASESSSDNGEYKDSIMSRIYKIDKILEKSYNRSVDLEKIAEALFLSKRQTSRIISKHYGVNFRELIVQMRMQKSAELLATTDEPISSIASGMGYSSMKGFYYIFKKYYGVLPSEYRSQCQVNGEKQQN